MSYYTGIGSRKCPPKTLQLMTAVAKWLYDKSMILRSGGADGADMAFEMGAGEKKEIFLPWKNFNNNDSLLYHIPDKAFEIASKIHTAWDKCSPAAKKLHSRNVMQIFGQDLHTFSQFVICWTPGGEEVGGTATAIRLAKKVGIPVYNLAIRSDRDYIRNEMKGVESKSLWEKD